MPGEQQSPPTLQPTHSTQETQALAHGAGFRHDFWEAQTCLSGHSGAEPSCSKEKDKN